MYQKHLTCINLGSPDVKIHPISSVFLKKSQIFAILTLLHGQFNFNLDFWKKIQLDFT